MDVSLRPVFSVDPEQVGGLRAAKLLIFISASTSRSIESRLVKTSWTLTIRSPGGAACVDEVCRPTSVAAGAAELARNSEISGSLPGGGGRLRQPGPPLGDLVWLTTVLVEPDHLLGGVGETGLARWWDPGLAGHHALVARDDRRLGVGREGASWWARLWRLASASTVSGLPSGLGVDGVGVSSGDTEGFDPDRASH
jgi:hypothetical protein